MFTYESNPIWDEHKEAIIGAESKSFDNYAESNMKLSGYWWRLNDKDTNKILGYGWFIPNEDEVEVLIAIAEDYRGKGLADKTLKFLEKQIKSRNLQNKILVIVKASNPYNSKVVNLLQKNNYTPDSFPIKDAIGVLEKGFNVSFYKKI